MTTADEVTPLLAVENLSRHFRAPAGLPWRRERPSVRAVDGVSFGIGRGETLGLVGESGCGKSTVGRLCIGLLRPTSGTVRFAGKEISTLGERAMRPLRRRFQLIFQDPYSALNPRMTVRSLLLEPLIVHGIGGRAEREQRIIGLLQTVGLARAHADRFPHEFSGGQRQRIAIARALAAGPELLVGDEPVSALDVSVQAQIINLLQELRERLGLTFILISHDLGVVRHLADRVLVMYLGRIVEAGPTRSLFAAPRHPYTQALLAALPRPRAAASAPREVLGGEVASPLAPPQGCHLHPRCPQVRDRCRIEVPELQAIDGDRSVACHFWREIEPSAAAAWLLPTPAPAYVRRLEHLRRATADAATGR